MEKVRASQGQRVRGADLTGIVPEREITCGSDCASVPMLSARVEEEEKLKSIEAEVTEEEDGDGGRRRGPRLDRESMGEATTTAEMMEVPIGGDG